MDVELKAAVESASRRYTLALERGDWKPSRAHIEGLRNLLDSVAPALQAPCPGKAGELRKEIGKILRDWLPLTCGRNCGREMTTGDEVGCYNGATNSILALLSAQPVPGGERVYSQAEVDSLLRAAYPSVPVAGEWVLVPKELTRAMMAAADSYIIAKHGSWRADWPGIYRAMLSASPDYEPSGYMHGPNPAAPPPPDSQTSGGAK